MTVVELAELLSAFAAFLTVTLAFIELSSRSKVKKADVAMDLYADYLCIAQQVDYLISDLRSFAENLPHLSAQQRRAYAENHRADQALFATVHDFEKNCVSSFDYASKEGKVNSSKVLQYAGTVVHLVTGINTLYQAILEDESLSDDFVQAQHRQHQQTYDSLMPDAQEVGALLRKNLKTAHNISTAYPVVLLIGTAVFLFICFIL